MWISSISEGELQGEGRGGHQQQSMTEEEVTQGIRETTQREVQGDNTIRDIVLTQADTEWCRSDIKVGEGSPGCQNISKGKSQVFSLSLSVKSFLVKWLFLNINKTLICCTSFPTLGFSGDNCPKTTVLMWLVLVHVYRYYFLYVIMW